MLACRASTARCDGVMGRYGAWCARRVFDQEDETPACEHFEKRCGAKMHFSFQEWHPACRLKILSPAVLCR